MKNHKQIKIILLLLAFLDMCFYSGYYASDDLSYIFSLKYFTAVNDLSMAAFIKEVSYFPEGHFELLNNIAMLRYGITIPTAFIYYITGKSLLAVYGLLMLMHVAMTYAVYRFTLKLKDESHALAIGFLVAMTPVFYVYAGAFFPDLLQTLYLFIAFYLSWKGLSEEKNKVLLIVISGFVFGLSYATKVSSIIMFVPFGLMYLEYFKFNIKELVKYFLLFSVGFLSLVSIEVIINLSVLGEPFPRFTIVKDAKDLYLKKMELNGVLPLDRLETVLYQFAKLYPISYLVVLLIGFVSALFSKLPYKFTLFIFAFWPFLYLTFGSTSLSEYLPPSIQARYYTLMMPWFVLLSGIGLMTIIQKISIIIIRKVAIVILFLLIPLLSIVHNHEKAGLLYRSAQVQTFTKAVEYSKEHYSEYVIVLNSYLTRRMQHVPIVNDNSIITLEQALVSNKPFIYIMPLQKLPAESDKNHLKSNIEAERYQNIKVLEKIYPKTRFTNKTVQKSRGMDIFLIK